MGKLAIKGHPTRGNEVIKTLEMLGGRNLHLQSGCGNGIYLINTCDNIIYFNQPKDIIYDFIILTLEEFLEKYPYKVGDKVTIEKYKQIFEILSVRWCTERNIIMYQTSNGWYCADKLQPYKEETMEGKVESFEILESYCANEVKIEFDPFKFEIVERDNVYYVVKKKTQYPKTYHECWKILGVGEEEVLFDGVTASEEVLFDSFIKLKRCRDAYWKIASDWNPDVMYCNLYCIGYDGNVVTWKMQGGCRLLAFPTEEMRDAFYDNFKDLIEQCKELL